MSGITLSDGVTSQDLAAHLVSLRIDVNAASGGGGSSIYAASVASVAALKALDISTLTAGERVWVDGYYNTSTKGGGLFYVEDTTDAADDGHLIAPTTPDGNKKYRRAGYNYRQVDPMEWGVKDDSSDASAGTNADRLQAAVDAMVAYMEPLYEYGCCIDFANCEGDVHIDDEIILKTELLELRVTSTKGQGTLVQITDNKMIFRMSVEFPYYVPPAGSNNSTYSIFRQPVFENLYFKWKNAQPATNTSAIAIGITDQVARDQYIVERDAWNLANGGSDTSTYGRGGTMRMTVRDCNFRNGFQGVGNMISGSNGYSQPGSSVSTNGVYWNTFAMDNCRFDGMSGEWVYMGHGPGARVTRLYGQCQLAEKPVLYFVAADSVMVDGVEVNDFSSAANSIIYFGNCGPVDVKNLQFERCTVPTYHNGFVHFVSDGTTARVGPIHYLNSTLPSSSQTALLRSYNSTVTIEGPFNFRGITVPSGSKLYIALEKNNGKLIWVDPHINQSLPTNTYYRDETSNSVVKSTSLPAFG